MNKQKITVAIIEDQQENIDILRFFFSNYANPAELKYIGTDGQAARQILAQTDIDVALLDIDLGDETIFDVLNSVDYSHLNKALIFVTAHGTFENALKAIRYSCLNFITKPIDFEELKKTLDQLIATTYQSQTNQIEVLLDILKSDVHSPERIGIVLSKGMIRFVDCKNILYFSAFDTISTIYLKDGSTLKSTKNLGYYSKLLSSHKDFLQIHKSTVVNLQRIQKFDARNRLVSMQNGEELEISRRQLVTFQRVIEKL